LSTLKFPLFDRISLFFFLLGKLNWTMHQFELVHRCPHCCLHGHLELNMQELIKFTNLCIGVYP